MPGVVILGRLKRQGIRWGKAEVAGYSCLRSAPRSHCAPSGGVAEWLKAHAWKACVGKNLPLVRIPPPPPVNLIPAVRSDLNLTSFLMAKVTTKVTTSLAMFDCV